jgi:hypothetical protein
MLINIVQGKVKRENLEWYQESVKLGAERAEHLLALQGFSKNKLRQAYM